MSWHDYLFGFADHAKAKSKDSTQVGAALVTDRKAVILTGYNGPPMGVRDTPERRERPAKYLFASHAEANLISFAARNGIKTEGCRVFTTHRSCATCARTLIQAGICEVIYGDGTTSMPEAEFEAAEIMFREAGVVVRSLRSFDAPSETEG